MTIFRREATPEIKRYSYPISGFGGIDALSKEETLSLNKCVYGYNISIEDNALKNGIGISEAKITLDDGVVRTIPFLMSSEAEIMSLIHYRKYNAVGDVREDELLALATDRYLYTVKISEGVFKKLPIYILSAKFSYMVYHKDNVDILYIYTADGIAYTYDGENVQKFENMPCLSSIALHYDRVYALDAKDKTKLHFSAMLDPLNFEVGEDLGGYIQLVDEGGALEKILVFKDYIFIFREYAVYKLTAYTDPKEYKLSKVFSGNKYIYSNTIAAGENRIIFASEDGFYALDGYDIVKIFTNLTPLVENLNKAVATYFKDKYYIALRMKNKYNNIVGDEKFVDMHNNAIFSVDLINGAVMIMRGVDITWSLSLSYKKNSLLLFGFYGYRKYRIGMASDSGKLFESVLEKHWSSPYSHLGEIDKIKALKAVRIKTDKDIEISVRQKKNRTVKLYGASVVQTARFADSNEYVSVSIDTNSDTFLLSDLQLDFNVYRRYYGDKNIRDA